MGCWHRLVLLRIQCLVALPGRVPKGLGFSSTALQTPCPEARDPLLHDIHASKQDMHNT